MRERERLVSRQLNPLLQSLPPKFQEFGENQIDAVLACLEGLEGDDRVVVLDAPTGSGKTVIAEVVRRMYNTRALYVCHNKDLQRQFKRDFPYAEVLQGRGNYQTELADGVYCDECTRKLGDSCVFCESKLTCPYEKAKTAARKADVGVVNMAYMLSEWNGPGRFSGQKLTIIDEADVLETVLMGHVGFRISEYRLKMMKVGPPEFVTKEDSWLEWAKEAEQGARNARRKAWDATNTKEHDFWNRMIRKIYRLRTDLETGKNVWVYCAKKSNSHVEFKPVKMSIEGESMIWRHSGKFLLMSATVISADEMLSSLGWFEERTVVSMDSTFPVANRLVKYKGVADMGRKNDGADDQVFLATIRDICQANQRRRILIHSVSYERTKQIVRYLGSAQPSRKVYSYDSAADRDQVLRSYLENEGSILVAPSMDRGVDLPGDACRVQIIAKVPYPNLGDPQINARLHTGQTGRAWYDVQTVRSLVQMTGRGVRSRSDSAETWILDKGFERLWNGPARGYFPKWWREAVRWM